MLKYLLIVLPFIFSVKLSAQPKPVIPLIRKVFHENVDKNQKEIDLLDKRKTGLLT